MVQQCNAIVCVLMAVVLVVFGELIEGLGVLRRMELCGSKSGKPKKRIAITKCGQVRATES